MTGNGPRLFYWRSIAASPQNENQVCEHSSRRALATCAVVACVSITCWRSKARALCVPVVANRTYLHRADIPLFCEREKYTALSGSLVVRCTRPRWHENGWDSLLQNQPALMRRVKQALQRDQIAQAIEASPAGRFRSALAHGPKLGNCGRKRGGLPSD